MAQGDEQINSIVTGEFRSDVIKSVRFPLTVLVIFIHILPDRICAVKFTDDGNVIEWAYLFISEMVSHNLGHIAVPTFFGISGFLFFYNGIDYFNIRSFNDKWKRRIRSLLIPYLIWNILRCIAVFAKNYVASVLGMPNDYGMEILNSVGLYDILWAGPFNGPLWYMRDLIVMSLLTPLFYLCYKYCRALFVVLLSTVYLLTFESGIPGLSTTAFFFFGIGGLLGYCKYDFLSLCERHRTVVLMAAMVLLVCATLLNANIAHKYIVRLLRITWVPSVFLLMRLLPDKVLDVFSKMAVPSFFIYVCHKIYILDWTNGLALKLFGDDIYGLCISYIVKPVLVITFCLVIYWLLKRIMPKTLSFLCGGR